MPRKAREKAPDAVYHIICRSVSEILLFRGDEDKDYYLGLLKRYIDKYKCSLYAYCLMDNHFHLHFDPKGCDVSRFMQSINTAYVRYFNKKYTRHGPVFQDRFESRILSSDEYNFAVSAYIHNNPKDIEEFSGKEETYLYSSLGIYLGLHKDTLKLIDKSFMMGLFNISDMAIFVQRYLEFVRHQRDIGSLKDIKKKLSSAAENEYISGRKVLLRERPVSKVISFISDKMMVKKDSLLAKSKRKLIRYRAFTAYVLNVLCGLGYREICCNMCNITISGCSRLCSMGHDLVNKDEVYENLFNELASCNP